MAMVKMKLEVEWTTARNETARDEFYITVELTPDDLSEKEQDFLALDQSRKYFDGISAGYKSARLIRVSRVVLDIQNQHPCANAIQNYYLTRPLDCSK